MVIEPKQEAFKISTSPKLVTLALGDVTVQAQALYSLGRSSVNREPQELQ